MTNSKKISLPFVLLIIIIFFIIVGGVVWRFRSSGGSINKAKNQPPEGMMVLIEYKTMADINGLSNMVNEMQKRGIHGLLYVGPDFVEKNCEEIKEISDYNVSLVGSCGEPLWNLTYEEQKEVMTETKKRIEACTGKELNFITSRYWGWDENTVKIASELGINNIFARGMVGNGAAVFKPEDYDVKILSISNIEDVEYKYGSVCDYSFWVRGGAPDDMLSELNDAVVDNHKVTPVSHTHIGGLKKDWLEMWKQFFDSGKVDWVSWEKFSEVDYEMPLTRIPANQNVPYTPEMKASEQEKYQEGENVENPCSVEELSKEGSQEDSDSEVGAQSEIVMFHNDEGPMCLEAKEFFVENNIEYEEVLTTDESFEDRLEERRQLYEKSEGVSESFGYYPIIFTEEKAYSGFNKKIKNEILEKVE